MVKDFVYPAECVCVRGKDSADLTPRISGSYATHTPTDPDTHIQIRPPICNRVTQSGDSEESSPRPEIDSPIAMGDTVAMEDLMIHIQKSGRARVILAVWLWLLLIIVLWLFGWVGRGVTRATAAWVLPRSVDDDWRIE